MTVQHITVDNFNFEATVTVPKRGWNWAPELDANQASGVAVGYILATLRMGLDMGGLDRSSAGHW